MYGITIGPYGIMMTMIVLLTPLLCWSFTRNQKDSRVPMNRIYCEIKGKKYYLHIMGYLLIVFWKQITDALNEPIKVKTGHYTDWVLAFEGESVLWIQDSFSNAILTDVLNFHYLFIYLFLIYVTTIYYMYTGERDLTDKVTLNYLLIYALAVPYYLFFNVEVTSSYIPGMEALLYHDGWYTDFYATHDPLDNCVPSLHIAIPFGILALNWLHVRDKGIKMKEWKHLAYHRFILWNTILFAFAILYLGIHWIVDIPLGIMIGGIGALFIHHIQPRLRNDFGRTFEGVNRFKFGRHALFEGIVVLLLFAAIMGGLNYQESTMDDRASMRLGPGDTKFDIIQPTGEEFAHVSVTNMDEEYTIQVTLLTLKESVELMENGVINWNEENQPRWSEEIGPKGTLFLQNEIVDFDSHHNEWTLLIIHHPGTEEVIDVHIYVEYTEGVPVNLALLLSIPSLWMTGFVIHRLVRLKVEGLPLSDSRPSHAWNKSSEDE